jgi:hypothetical protein
MYSHNRSDKPCKAPALQSTGLLAAVKERARYMHYSLRTEEAYVHWIRRSVLWHGRRHLRTIVGATPG